MPVPSLFRTFALTGLIVLAQPLRAELPALDPLTTDLLVQAAQSPRGTFPRTFHGEQAYWTVIGEPDSPHAALLSEDGLLEPWAGGPSIEPFIHVDGQRLGWAEVATGQGLEDGDLPIPTVTWRAEGLRLDITALAVHESDQPLLLARYRVTPTGDATRAIRLELALRPLQVYPPWLQLAVKGGGSPIRSLDMAGATLRINDEHTVTALTPGGAFERQDGPGRAGAWSFPMTLAPGATREVILAIPFAGSSPPPLAGRAGEGVLLAQPAPAALFARHLAEQRERWRDQLDRVTLKLPTPEGEALAKALRASLAYMLIHSPRPLIRPGSRGYARAWIRDGALMAHALLQLGHEERARAFLRGYASMQQPDGAIPCCIDERGPDPTVEHDSHGEYINLLAETLRHTGDDALARELWPTARRAAEHILALRARRLTPEYDAPELRRFRGLLPESASHEGYLQHPVHSYWDDFFALRGLKDAAWLAERLGDAPAAARYRREHAAMQADVAASIRLTMRDKGLTTLPASADLGDFDPTSTAIALSPTQEDGLLPSDALHATFDDYLAMVRERTAGSPRWPGYTPYEWRNVEALVRMGRRDEAWALLRLLFADRRPLGWNAWPEVIWADPRRPDYIGDMPHGWAAGEFIRALLSLIVHPRESDQALIIGAGLPPSWLDAPEGLHVRGLSTRYGRLDLDIERSASGVLQIRVGGDLRAPPGGVWLDLPLPLKGRAIRIDGQPFEADGQAIKLAHVPATVTLHDMALPSPAPRSP
ncbi:MAG: hypothetical protein FNT29_08825 [Halothiobacillaceae bacterium]|nr:MAG: hypothetical protein FNT29_08825 [Halothiobacillaceae bacterium]